jgi:hypothetical protein
LLAAAAVLLAATVTGIAYLGRGEPAADGRPAAAAPSPSDTAAEDVPQDESSFVPDETLPTESVPIESVPAVPSPERAVGIVTIDGGVTDARADDIARMLDVHFGGINGRDYGSAASVFDPKGAIDPGDPDQMYAFAAGLATTSDSNIRLYLVSNNPDGRPIARVTFDSTQAAGYGPRGREAETCTHWDVTYLLTATARAGYLIFRGSGTSAPC